jgi:hypothetical protein
MGELGALGRRRFLGLPATRHGSLVQYHPGAHATNPQLVRVPPSAKLPAGRSVDTQNAFRTEQSQIFAKILLGGQIYDQSNWRAASAGRDNQRHGPGADCGGGGHDAGRRRLRVPLS